MVGTQSTLGGSLVDSARGVETQADDHRYQRLPVESGTIGRGRGSNDTHPGENRTGAERLQHRRVFAGQPGTTEAFGTGVVIGDGTWGQGGEKKDCNSGAWCAFDPEKILTENLSLTDLVSLAYMFNFTSESGVLGLGERKAVVQVGDVM